MSPWVREHFRDGRRVRRHWRRSPGGQSSHPGPSNFNENGERIVIAIGVTVVIIASGWTGISFLSSKTGKSASPRTPKNALTTEAQAGFKQADATLKVGHFRTKLSMGFDNDCARHSEGQVRDYFQANPCKYMARAYIQVNDANRGLAHVAITWVEMPSATSAMEYKHLFDIGAGKVIELSRESKSLKNATFENRTYTSGTKGNFVWTVEVAPLFSTTPDSVINEVLAGSRQQ
ncbi:hypothetical protein [Actinomadura sp. 6N118]|uniref:hypothetical protein n=1 Tax=Actinomadura sp. 6N118 TaxID=3375151 RepID=UPI0037AA0BF1